MFDGTLEYDEFVASIPDNVMEGSASTMYVYFNHTYNCSLDLYGGLHNLQEFSDFLHISSTLLKFV